MTSPKKNSKACTSAHDDDCSAKLSDLQNMTHSELKLLWVEAFKSAAPKNLSRRLIIHALAYQIQVRAYCGLSKSVQQELLEKAIPSLRRSAMSGRKRPSSVNVSPGTRLMREWHGVVHVVDRTADGFLWNGRTFRSLSAIAWAITGARWNGLAFFGLRKKQVDSAREIAA